MARVKKEILSKIEEYLNGLDDSLENKCTLCNETLTHITNQCSAQTGAPKNTITTIITKRFNATALPADKLGNTALRDRVKRKEGIKEADRLLKSDNSDNTYIVLLKDFNTMLLTRQLLETKGDLFLANELVDLFEKRAGEASTHNEIKKVSPKMQDDIDKLKVTCSKLRAKNTLLQQQVKELQDALLEYDKIPVVKSEQEQRDEFINKARKAKDEKAIAERKYFGVSEDGTPV